VHGNIFTLLQVKSTTFYFLLLLLLFYFYSVQHCHFVNRTNCRYWIL